MALPILDGNQTAATLSTVLTGGEHIPAHTVVSLGSQAITDMRSAVSGSVVSISNFPASQSTTFGAVTGSVSVLNFPSTQTIAGTVTIGAGTAQIGSVTASISNSVTISSLPAISGTVTANLGDASSVIGGGYPSLYDLFANETVLVMQSGTVVVDSINNPISGTVTANLSSTNLNSVTIGVRGSVTASIGNSVTIASLPAISGTVTANTLGTRTFVDVNAVTVNGFLGVGGWDAANSQHAPIPLSDGGTGVRVAFDSDSPPFQVVNHPSVTFSATISGTVTANVAGNLNGTIENYDTDGAVTHKVAVQIYDPNGQALGGGAPLPISGTVTASSAQGTSVTISNFTSTTASTTLASANSARRGLTVFNEGAGNLHICAGATATTLAYQVRLSAGDYWECPAIQTSLTHSAQFASAGTARVVEIT